MRILALSPFRLDAVSGNVTTLRRIREGMEALGHTFKILPVTASTSGDDVRQAARRARADVLHFYHSYKTGRLLPAVPEIPSVVTVSGTDLNHDIDDPALRAAIVETLERSARIVTYNRSLAERLGEIAPALPAKMTLLPKGVLTGRARFDLRAAAGLGKEDFVFLHPGGIRPVKNNIFAIDGLAPLRRARLVFAGPVVDAAYGEGFRRRIRARSWIRHLDRIPAEAMTAAYRAADVVLNTSLSEGLSNALMEAMLAGRPVLASDIPGNRDLIEPGRTGLLYRSRPDFTEKARRLVEDAGLRTALGRAAAAHAAANFSTDREIEALVGVYKEAAAKNSANGARPGTIKS